VLRDRLSAWAAAHIDELRTSKPLLPSEISDRAQDCVEPLLAIAEVAGDGWGARARSAVIELCTGVEGEDQSIRVQLLADIYSIITERNVEHLSSVDLVDALNQLPDRPWCEFNHGKPITQRGLAKLLGPFAITPKQMRIGGDKTRGYAKADLEDAFSRYLGSQAVQAVQPAQTLAETYFSQAVQERFVPIAKSEESPINTHLVPLVPIKTPDVEAKAKNIDGGLAAARRDPRQTSIYGNGHTEELCRRGEKAQDEPEKAEELA
jgi:hypothetical protein